MNESSDIKNPICSKALKWISDHKEKIYNGKTFIPVNDETTIEALFLLYASTCTLKECYNLAKEWKNKAKSIVRKDEKTNRIFENHKEEASWFVDKLGISMGWHPSQVTGTGWRLYHVAQCLFGISIKRKDIVKILCKNKEFKKELLAIVA